MRRIGPYASWRAECRVDGRYLEGSDWPHPSNTFIKRHLIQDTDHDESRKGDLTFAPAVRTLKRHDG